MAYICKKKNREGSEYTFLCEGYRLNGKTKQRTLKYFGKTTDEEYLELRERCASGEFDNLKSTNNLVQLSLNLNHTCEKNLSKNVGWKVLDEIYKELGISPVISEYSKGKKYKYSLDEVLKLLIFGRILDPKSKFQTVNAFQERMFGEWSVTQNSMDRALDHLFNLKCAIQSAVHKSISKNIGRAATPVFYDVTNYYFEIDTADDFRKRGPSKEHRPKPIVQMGLFMDSNGIPISYELFEGNCVDPKTYKPAIEQTKKQFGIKKIVTVADKAMNSASNVLDAHKKGDGWLFSSKFRGKRGAPKDIQNFALDETGWKYSEDGSFASKSMIRNRKLDKDTAVEEKVLVTWRKSYAVREKYKRQEVLKVAYKMTKSEMERQLTGKGVKKFLTAFDPETGEKVKLSSLYSINDEQIEFDEQFDGMNAIVTSETHMKDEEMIAAYGQLVRIEDCFRVTKTNLSARPVFVWTRQHIEAHFLTCFLALIILRILQVKTGRFMSVNRMISALQSAKVNEIGNGLLELFKSEDSFNLYKRLGKNIWNQYYKIEQFLKI